MEDLKYFTFDKIEKDDLGCHYGYRGEWFCEVYLICDDDDDNYLIEHGYAKCDAPGTETMIVELSSMLSAPNLS